MGLESGHLTVLTECEAQELEGERQAGVYRASGVRIACRVADTGDVVLRSRRESARRRGCRRRVFHVGAVAADEGPSTSRSDRREGLSAAARAGVRVVRRARHPARRDRRRAVHAVQRRAGDLQLSRFPAGSALLVAGQYSVPGKPRGVRVTSSARPNTRPIMRRYHYTSSVTITTRDNPERSRVILDRGRATLDFRESRRDVDILRDSLLHAARGFLGVGARRVFMPLLRPPRIGCAQDRGRLRAPAARLRRSPVVLGSHERGNADGTGQPPRRDERRRPAVRYRECLRGRFEPVSFFVRRQSVVDDHGAQPSRGEPPVNHSNH